MDIKKKYMSSRLDRLDKDGRNLLAEREIYTAEYLLEKFYDLDLKKYSSVIDYGCGDKFL